MSNPLLASLVVGSRRAATISLALAMSFVVAGCSSPPRSGRIEVTFPGSGLGAEAQVLRRQLDAFMVLHPNIRVVQQATPDAADQRHQLYVQWLNAGASDPDILQLDVVWTPEFAAAGWILPLDSRVADPGAFVPAAIAASRWGDSLFAVPWFVDVGMLYWRTDLVSVPPITLAQLAEDARRVVRDRRVRYGLVWQGARYEGLVTTFLEYLGGFGGTMMEGGRVTVGSDAGRRALAEMGAELYQSGVVPTAVLTWHEEETRFAFQNGEAGFMRNWPYAYRLMNDSGSSRVAGRFAAAPMPAAPGGRPTAVLGGSQLAINRRSDHPDSAWAVIAYLTDSERMLERARAVGQLPARFALYRDTALAAALSIPLETVREVIDRAVARPVTPVYSELSEILQIQLHRALTGQIDPATALETAERRMRALLDRVELGPGRSGARR